MNATASVDTSKISLALRESPARANYRTLVCELACGAEIKRSDCRPVLDALGYNEGQLLSAVGRTQRRIEAVEKLAHNPKHQPSKKFLYETSENLSIEIDSATRGIAEAQTAMTLAEDAALKGQGKLRELEVRELVLEQAKDAGHWRGQRPDWLLLNHADLPRSTPLSIPSRMIDFVATQAGTTKLRQSLLREIERSQQAVQDNHERLLVLDARRAVLQTLLYDWRCVVL